MNMKQLKYVQVLAHEGTFSKAAEVLNISQPSLSQYIKKIEAQVGMRLFDRTGSDVRVTDAGRVYIEIGRKILDLEHQMEVSFSDISSRKTGSLIVGASPYRSAGMMPLIAKRFQERYPGIHIVVKEGTTSELIEGMEHGAYDFCLTMLPIDERIFRYENVTQEELVLAVPASFPMLKSEIIEGRKYHAIDVKQIDGQSLVMITETQVMQKELDNLCVDYDLRLQKAAVVKSLEAQIAMVRAGVGMAFVPSGIERFVAKEEVTFYSFKQELPKRQIVVIWHKDRELSDITKELKEVIHQIEW